jgi:hypothetical protein
MVSPNSAVPRAVAPSPGKRAHGHRPVRIRQPLRLVDVRTIPAEALLGADFRHPAIVEATELFARADGVVVGTPVYKAPYSGVLTAGHGLGYGLGVEFAQLSCGVKVVGKSGSTNGSLSAMVGTQDGEDQLTFNVNGDWLQDSSLYVNVVEAE